MARIAGVNLPNQKRLEIGLTYIYGIGQPTARRIAAALGLSPDTKIRDLSATSTRTSRSRATSGASARRRSSASRRSAPTAANATGAGCPSTVNARRRTRVAARAPRRPSDAGRKPRRRPSHGTSS